MNRTIKTLADLGLVYNGAVEMLFQRAMLDLVADLESRPIIKTARIATVKIRASPRININGQLTGATVQITVQSKLPKTHTGDIAMLVDSKVLSYEPLALDDPHQTTLAFKDDQPEAVAPEEKVAKRTQPKKTGVASG